MLYEWAKVTHQTGLKYVNLNFRDDTNVEKSLIASDKLIANQLQERSTRTCIVTLKCMSLVDV